MVKIRPALAVSMALYALMFVSSIACLFLRPDLSIIAPLWEAALLISTLATIISFWTARDLSGNKVLRNMITRKKVFLLAVDLLFSISVFLLVFTGTLHPGFVIERPIGMGASFDYSFILSGLVFVASILGIKDAINILYG
ncbi:MAG: phosphate ABC transporter, permease protein PstA, partial [Methanotrichaceae archaeon]|nr:phosphate ABC transporter, permease protein PstA [Methanotrichaceae archaeon]